MAMEPIVVVIVVALGEPAIAVVVMAAVAIQSLGSATVITLRSGVIEIAAGIRSAGAIVGERTCAARAA
jgi:hypothetical protein